MADPLRELRHGEVVWAESDLTGPLTIDLDSIVEVHGRTEQGAASALGPHAPHASSYTEDP
jgi:hypothetical protein